MRGLFQWGSGMVVWSLLVTGAHAQRVQLPRFDQFSARSSVRVPDRGAAHLGGVRRSFRGGARYGTPIAGKLPGVNRLFGNRSLSVSDSDIRASVHVTIIDHEALDQQVLAEAKRQRTGRSNATPRRPDPQLAEFSRRLTRQINSDVQASQGLMSVAEIRRKQSEGDAEHRRKVLRLVADGRRAEEEGKLAVAEHAYRTARRQANRKLPDRKLQETIETRIIQLSAKRDSAHTGHGPR